MAADPKKLKSQLQITGLQDKDNPTFQLLSQIIDFLGSLNSSISGGSGGGSSTVTNITNIITGGPPGIDGNDGEDALGAPGAQGIQGITGSPGPAGPVIFAQDGEDGLSGFNIPVQGPQGIQGIQGPAGPPTLLYPQPPDDPDILLVPGPQGIQGITGPQGPPGFSLLNWVDDGDDGLIGPQGPQGAGSSGGTSPYTVTTVTLTDAQLRGLNATPVTIVPAQGAGIILIPEFFIATVDVTTSFSAGQTVSVRWSGQATLALPGISLSLNSIAKRIGFSNSSGAAVLLNGTVSTYENVALEVTGSGTPTGGVSRGGTLITIVWITTTIP